VIAESTRRLVCNLLQTSPAGVELTGTGGPFPPPGIVIEPILFYPEVPGIVARLIETRPQVLKRC
jgi:hypothetical protein